jgi:hypothetical protein
LCTAISSEFDAGPRALELFDELLSRRAYGRDFAIRLIEIARREAGDPWEIRRLAALMLENQLLKLSPEDTTEFEFLLDRLELVSSVGGKRVANSRVIKEGFSTTELHRFVPEFQRRLVRTRWLHERLAARASRNAIVDFARYSQCECKISIARYLFKPAEVVERILTQLRTSTGVPDLDQQQPLYIEREVAHALESLPDYEAQILRGLCGAPIVYWVSEATSSEINSLVEYPLTTVVLVVKPPGSSVEFEIKRAGKKRGPALNVVYQRGDYIVPPPHRLDGGSMLSFLRREARAGSLFSLAYRKVHGSDAPMSRMVSRSSIFAVPRNGTEDNILEYFTSPYLFGKGFREMRAALKDCVYAFNDQDRQNAVKIPGELGLAVHFVTHSTPGQAVIAGSSSFRLDKIARYLSPRGAALYFKQGLRREYSTRDGKRLVDAILEEILGVYFPPEVAYRSHRQYVAAAFTVAANRLRADRAYFESSEQLGKFWGTMLALRAYSWGESFVARNVGLKSCWRNGEWKVQIIFMDHDCLTISDKSERDFYSLYAYNGIATDARYIGANLIATTERQTAFYFLAEIYRVDETLIEEAKQLFYRSTRKAYDATHDAMRNEPDLRRLFHKVLLERLRDWDELVADYIKMKREGSAGLGFEAWKDEVRKKLKEKGYSRALIDNHLQTIQNNSEFIENHAFLY